MKIYNQQGRILYEGQVEDNSYASDAIMDDNSLTLYIKTTEPLELPVGAYCTFENQKYTLMRPESFKKNNSRNFSYTVTMESDAAKAKIWKFRNPVDGRLQFSLTAKPIEHLQMVVDNLNRRDGGWSVGQCIDDVEHTITYDHNYIIDALVAQATEFNTEYEFKGKVVNLRKVEYNKNNPLPLSYGRGNGFKTGVGRSNQNENMPVEILFVQGGTKNIDPSQYGHKELLLPEGGEIAYDGQYFEDEEGFNEKTARHYIVSEDRLSIRRDDGVLSTLAEDSLDCSGVYPKREGLVSEVITVDAEKNFYDFTDSSIPSTLNFEDHLIEGEKMTVIFQSGMLAGRGEFEVKYYHDAQDGKLGRRFEIVPQEIDGETMPNETYKPSKDDKYAVFNCTLPEEYMNDKEHKQGAEWDMFRTAVKYKYENEDQKFTFTGTLDGIWSKKDWINIGGRIILGGYISFSDNQFQKEGVNVRITAVKKYINNPHSPEITLSNSTVTGSVTGTLNELQAQEIVIQETRREAIQYTKRRFRDAQETSEMLRALIDSSVDSLTQQFTEGITPISIQTMQMLVGDESLQFRYVNSDKNPQPVGDGITYDTEMKQLHAPERIVQHMTLGISTISSSHTESEYRFWRVVEFNSAVLEDAGKKYYLYIKAAENGTGSYTLSEKALDFKEGTTYNLLVGVLNSEYDGVRSFATLYGFTEILPSRITTDKIVSGDGTSYFDMQNNAMKLGDAMDFNSDGTKRLKLKGTLVQSESGDFIDIGSFRGEYNSKTTYFLGDTVTYTPSGKKTSTYKSISEQQFTGIAPTNELYWSLTAAGGEDGTSISIKGTTNGHYTNKNAFVTAGHTSGTFLIDMKEDESPVSYHWVAKRSGSTWAYSQAELGDGYMDAEGYLWVAEENGWKNVGKIKGEDGQQGKSPAAIYRGTYDASKTYYGNEFRLDVVKYGSTYYIAQITAGTFSNVVPTNTSKWNAFGASFDSVATNLLLAENANVGGWIFRNGVLESENGSSWLNGKTGQARLRGTMQLSTAYKGVTTDANIFYMPAITASKSVGLTAEKTDIGKVCRFYNSSAKGGGTWTIYIYEDVTCTQDANGNTYTSRYKYTGYRVAPKESIEFTCFERQPPNSYEKSYSLSWQCTNRFTVNEWQRESCKGRYPRILAMGKITGTSNTAYLSGEFHDGRSISSVFSVSRSEKGEYTVSFASGTLPSGYFVFVVGSSPIYGGSNPNKASIDSKGTTSFVVSISDDTSRNDGSVDFIIFSPNWSYSTDWD